MLLHLAPLDDWLAHSERPYAPASLAVDGFVHCSADEKTVLAVANARFPRVSGPLMVLLIDEQALDAPVRWEAASPAPPPGLPQDALFPHIYGPVNRSAVVGMLEVVRDASGQWAVLEAWS